MVFPGETGDAVFDNRHAIIPEHRLHGGEQHADMSHRSGQTEGIDAEPPEYFIEVRPEKTRIRRLVDDDVFPGRFQLVDDSAPGSASHGMGWPAEFGKFPVIRRMGVADVYYGNARGMGLIDLFFYDRQDFPRVRDLQRRSLEHKIIQHVKYQQSLFHLYHLLCNSLSLQFYQYVVSFARNRLSKAIYDR